MRQFNRLPAREDLLRELKYEPETGILRWRTYKTSRAMAGMEAGCKAKFKSGTRVLVNLWGTMWQAPRLIWMMETGEDPGERYIDHIDGNTENNRWDNLRLVTPVQNQMNRKKDLRNTSGHTGVIWDKHNGKWLVRFTVDGKRRTIGGFVEKSDAIRVSEEIRNTHHGEYRRKHKNQE
jgi:hypothetical protein